MNKKNLYVNNGRQGAQRDRNLIYNLQNIQYPDAITADGKYIRAINLDKGKVKRDSMKFYFFGCEGDDNEEMKFVERPHSNGVTKYFRHKRGYIDRKEKDRYLHNRSEYIIKQRFDESAESGVFPVQYYIIEKCPIYDECRLKTKFRCNGSPKASLKSLNLRELYDTCTPERGSDRYVADLLLTNSKDKSIRPLFLEIFVTHKCSENKINSGHQIIEIKINEEKDAENDIIENVGDIVDEYVFMQPENTKTIPPIQFFGFERNKEYKEHVKFACFTLIKDHEELIGNCTQVSCADINRISDENEVLRLAVPLDELNNNDLYEWGMALAYSNKLSVCDCTLCKYYKLKDYINRPCSLVNMSFLFKDKNGNDKQINNPAICQLPYRTNIFDKSKYASECHEFEYDKERIKHIIQTLESTNCETKINNVYTQESEYDFLVPLVVCRNACNLNKWDCGYCGNVTSQDNGERLVVCLNPDKSFIKQLYRGDNPFLRKK